MNNILMYVDSCDIGGTTKSAFLLAKNLDKSKYNVFFAYKNGGPRQGQILEYFGDRLFQVRDASHFQSIVDNNKIDLVHTHRSGEPHFPQIAQDFNGTKFVETSAFGGYDSSPFIDRTLFMSEWLLNYHKELYPRLHTQFPKRFDFLNNPIDSYTAKNYIDIDPEYTVVGRCGRPDDGIYDDISVKAIWLLQSKGYKLHFIAVAPPPKMLEDLKHYEIPHTIINSTTDDEMLTGFYGSLDIYCHSRADGETFGSNIAEAMEQECPVVTHIAVPKYQGMTVYQAQTKLVENSVTGFVVQYNVNEYADAVEKLINNDKLRSDMGLAGLKKMMRECSRKAVVDKLEKIYESLLHE